MRRPLRARSLAACLPLLALLGACEPAKSKYVPYIPGPGFTETMHAAVRLPDSTTVLRPGEWATLHASRESGPWRLKTGEAANEKAACERTSPALQESEVAAVVQWHVEPNKGVSYNVPGASFERQIRFERPGTYQVWAVSRGCKGQITSNRVEVVVR
jgi:hypothetical protein